MTNFNLASLDQWKPVDLGVLFSFDLPTVGSRTVEFDFIADSEIAVTVISGDETWLVAYGSGLNSVRFTTDRVLGIVFEGDPSATCMLKTRTETQVMQEDGSLVPYTTIEPRQNQVPDEMRRMMQMMKLNAARREEQLRRELDERDRRMTELIERDRAPTLAERAQAAAQDTPPPVAETEGGDE